MKERKKRRRERGRQICSQLGQTYHWTLFSHWGKSITLDEPIPKFHLKGFPFLSSIFPALLPFLLSPSLLLSPFSLLFLKVDCLSDPLLFHYKLGALFQSNRIKMSDSQFCTFCCHLISPAALPQQREMWNKQEICKWKMYLKIWPAVSNL